MLTRFLTRSEALRGGTAVSSPGRRSGICDLQPGVQRVKTLNSDCSTEETCCPLIFPSFASSLVSLAFLTFYWPGCSLNIYLRSRLTWADMLLPIRRFISIHFSPFSHEVSDVFCSGCSVCTPPLLFAMADTRIGHLCKILFPPTQGILGMLMEEEVGCRTLEALGSAMNG